MAKTTTVDFSGVKDRGDFSPKRVTEGDYAATITKVEDGESKAGNFQYIFTIKLKKFSQNTYPYYCTTQDNQLWKLRNLAIAAGINIPKKRMKFDPNKLVGKTIGVTMADDDPYEGKIKSVIDAVFPVSELAEGDDVETSDEEFDEEGPQLAADDEDDASEDEAEAKPKKSKKDKAGKKDKGKKGKKKKGSDEDLEELDISDV